MPAIVLTVSALVQSLVALRGALVQLKLSQKAYTIVVVQLAVQIGFVAVLYVHLSVSETTSREASNARQLMGRCQHILDMLLGAAKGIAAYNFTGNELTLKKYQQLRACFLDDLHAIDELIARDKLMSQKWSKARLSAELVYSFLRESQRLCAIGEEHEGRAYLKRLRYDADALNTQFTEIINYYSEVAAQAPGRGAAAMAGLRQAVLWGLVINCVAAVIVAAYFNKSLVSRLKVLMDNAGRLERMDALNPPVKGGDEIARLDEFFHTMAGAVVSATNDLQSSETSVRSVIDGMPLGVITLAPDGQVHSLNPAATAMFHLPDIDASFLHFSDMVNLSAAQSQDLLAQDSRKHKRTIELYAHRADDTAFAAEVALTPYTGIDGDELLAVVKDITARRELEQMKKDFVAMVSHDLRTPLTSVKMSLELLVRGTYGELTVEGAKRVDLSQANCTHLINLVNELIEIEKMESGKLEVEMGLVELDLVLARTRAAVASFAEKGQVTIAIEDTDCEARGDMGRVTQVAINLVSNAIKFSPAGSTVTLSACAEGPWVRVSVCDQGRGIPYELQASVFERFKQVAKEDATEKGGTGLGLAICKAIVEAHGGSIGLESEPGRGSTFYFLLPNMEG